MFSKPCRAKASRQSGLSCLLGRDANAHRLPKNVPGLCSCQYSLRIHTCQLAVGGYLAVSNVLIGSWQTKLATATLIGQRMHT